MAPPSPDSLLALLADLHHLLARGAALDAQPHTFGTGQPLSRTEIHLVSAIADHPDWGTTEHAAHHEVTKGAISQTLKRLEAKGLITRAPGPGRRVALGLTPLGLSAHHAHEALHRSFLDALLPGYADEAAVLADRAALGRLREAMERYAAQLDAGLTPPG